MASIFNVDVNEALVAVQAGLRGESQRNVHIAFLVGIAGGQYLVDVGGIGGGDAMGPNGVRYL